MSFKSKIFALTAGAVLLTGVAASAFGQGIGPMAGSMGPETFVKIDTNQDKVLSPGEIHAYVAGMIKGLDANGDGYLTADEIAAKMTELTRDQVLTRATAMAARLDKSGAGKVSVDELAKMRTPMDGMLDRMLKAGGGKITQATFDTVMAMRGEHGPGQDGKPSPARWGGPERWGGHGERMRGHEHGHGPGGMMGLFGPIKFSDIDTKGQGFITAEDIQAYKLARLKAIDKDGDGYITPAEFTDFEMQRITPRIQQRADDLVKRLDLNGDGKLSIEELAAAPLDMMFAHLPTDKDGNVTEQAFLGAFGAHHGWRHRGGPDGMMPPAPAPDAPVAPSGN